MNKTKASLIDFDNNRQNNFTIIRILLAWSVLYGHSYAIQNPNHVKDPLNILFQGSTWIGDLAVDGFFAISGFLVAASFIKRGLKDFLISRALRIFPALLLCITASVFILGPALTNIGKRNYLSQPMTYRYLWNAIPYSSALEWNLPGVFEGNTFEAVNGSIWTLPVEIRCYLLLALIGSLGLFKNRTIANFFMLALLLIGIFSFATIPFLGIGADIDWSRPALYFLIGVFFYINRKSIFFNRLLFLLAALLMFVSFGEKWYPYTFPLAYSYIIFYLAYATKFINVDERIGDISYGIYIYAWPIQQIVAHFFLNFNPLGNTILSSIFVILIAYLSWHFVEKPALGLKRKLLAWDKLSQPKQFFILESKSNSQH